jgi:heavy metal efflux system protein
LPLRLPWCIQHDDGKIIDNDDVVSGIALLRKGAPADPALKALHEKIDEMNDHILPKGVKIVPFIDRSDLVHFTSHTVLHNLTEGMILVSIILFIFLGNVRGALIVAATIPFSLLFASICLDLKGIPANLLSLGALDFGMVVDGAVVMIENIVRHMGFTHGTKPPQNASAKPSHEVQRPVFLRHRHHHHRLFAHLHAAARRRPPVPSHGLDRRLRPAGRADLLHPDRSGPGQFRLRQGREGMA